MSIKIIDYTASPGFGIVFPTKTFIIEEKNQIHIISPSDLSEKVISELNTTKKKLNFIAPNNYHNMYLSLMKEKFPNANFYGPKRSAIQSKVELQKISHLSSDALQMIKVEGHKALSETCFFHIPTKILIVTDLFFNLQHKMNLSMNIMMRLMGCYHKMATSRAIKFSITDKKLYKESLQELARLKPEKIIPSHGESVTQEAFYKWVNQSL